MKGVVLLYRGAAGGCSKNRRRDSRDVVHQQSLSGQHHVYGGLHSVNVSRLRGMR